MTPREMMALAQMKPLKSGMTRYVASDGSVHDAMSAAFEIVREADEGVQILADSPGAWRTFVKSQSVISGAWSVRHTFTAFDKDFLQECGIAWDGPAVLTPKIETWHDEPVDMYSLCGDESPQT